MLILRGLQRDGEEGGIVKHATLKNYVIPYLEDS